ncbi:MAG: hypothetical protein AAGL98_12215, partial [Planctomycetota bacterium]
TAIRATESWARTCCCWLVDTKGMCAAYEFMVVTPAIANLIREAQSFKIPSAIQTGKKFGMKLLDDFLWELYADGKIAAGDMIDRGSNADHLIEKVHRAGGTVGRPELDDDAA